MLIWNVDLALVYAGLKAPFHVDLEGSRLCWAEGPSFVLSLKALGCAGLKAPLLC